MTDDLVVSTGGVRVASDELLAQAEGLSRLQSVLASLRAQASVAVQVTAGQIWRADAPGGVVNAMAEAERAVESAGDALGAARQCAESTTHALRVAMERYRLHDAVVQGAVREVSATAGYAAGYLASVIGMLVGPGATLALLGGMLRPEVVGTVASMRPALASLDKRDLAEFLTNPAIVELIRASVMSVDDVAGGAMRLPEPLVRLLGDRGLRLTGLDTSAAAALAAAGVGGFVAETPVSVRRAGGTRQSAPPGNVTARAARIPHPDSPDPPAPREAAGGPQVRIDRLHSPGRADRFEVYIAGTIALGLATGDEPWDMTSNLAAIAEESAGSMRAVREAMRQAGVTADSPVVLTGYSQGGLIASQLAASGDFDVRGVLTFGAPAGQVEIPSSVPVLAVRHSDDIVPALGGYDVSAHAVVVEREAFADRAVTGDDAVPAHQLDRYRETAALVDGARSELVRRPIDAFDAFVSGTTTVDTTEYLATRVASVGHTGGR